MAKKLSPAKYSNALALIDLIKIGFQEICSTLHVENSIDGEITVNVKNDVDLQVDLKENQLLAVDEYSVTGIIKGKTLFEIKLRILAAFRTKVDPTEDFLKLFQDNTLKVITYPYVRHEVQDLTSKMGLPPFVMPIWRVRSTAKKELPKSSQRGD